MDRHIFKQEELAMGTLRLGDDIWLSAEEQVKFSQPDQGGLEGLCSEQIRRVLERIEEWLSLNPLTGYELHDELREAMNKIGV